LIELLEASAACRRHDEGQKNNESDTRHDSHRLIGGQSRARSGIANGQAEQKPDEIAWVVRQTP